MINNFCEQFLLNYNFRLSSDDLMLLAILSEKYDVFDYNNLILTENINTIISKIIIDQLPYKYASRFVLNNTNFTIIAGFKDKTVYKIVERCPCMELIDKEIERINMFYKLKLIENGN